MSRTDYPHPDSTITAAVPILHHSISLSHDDSPPRLSSHKSSTGSPPNDEDSNSRSSKHGGRTVHRVSLACLQCRSRHMKCDAVKPCCTRCSAEGVPCTYARSRRRGHRRTKLPEEVSGDGPGTEDSHASAQSHSVPSRASLSVSRPISTTSAYSSAAVAHRNDIHRANMGITSHHRGAMNAKLNSGFSAGGINEDLINLYYSYFHAAHPCVLPRWSLNQHYAANPLAFTPVVFVMQFIGSLFDPSVSTEMCRDMATRALPLSQDQSMPLTPHQIQALLLFSITLYWSDEIERSLDLLGLVIHRALEMQMHHSAFATQNSRSDPVLEESWRRTWWQIYITEGHIASSARTFPSRIGIIEMTTMLPCEEEAYESGVSPTPPPCPLFPFTTQSSY